MSTSDDQFIGFQCEWGPNTATYGQTITAPSADSLLDGFSFFITQMRDLSRTPSPPTLVQATIDYRAYVYAWDGSKATGAPLWTSGPRTHTTTAGSYERVEVPFATDQLPLTPGARYVLFLSMSPDYALNATTDKACFARGTLFDSYFGGSFMYQRTGADISNWTSASWSSTGGDLAFRASFSAPPVTQIYEFDGFYAPVENRGADGRLVLNEVRAGQAIPVKFSLGGDYGLDIFDVGYPKSEAITCESDAEVNGVDQTVQAGSSSLSYSAGSDTYNYVWKTDTAWDDSCRQLVVKFNDGTTARANFKFKP